MHPLLVLFSGYLNATPGIDSESASKVINNISETTTHEEFEDLIKINAIYNFRNFNKGSFTSRGRTALHQAVLKGNYDLAIYLIEKFGKDTSMLWTTVAKP
ncbi:MAG: hypothetical protein H0T62_08365 [Parachlamydiaceae bacterium]|nr:hypothetical protein [Parachlamydiaceae bacterium]